MKAAVIQNSVFCPSCNEVMTGEVVTVGSFFVLKAPFGHSVVWCDRVTCQNYKKVFSLPPEFVELTEIDDR